VLDKNQCYSVDLTNREDVITLNNNLTKIKIDIVIHLASRMASADNIDDISILLDNIKITENLVFMIKKLRPKLLINFSSMAVYPNISGFYSENSLPMPQKNNDCFYGLSKYNSEVLFDYLLRNEEISKVHLRVAQVYGEGMRKDRIISTMKQELKDKNTITVYGNGNRENCFIKISKLSELINCLINNKVNGLFNIGDENISYIKLAKRIIENHGNSKSTLIMESKGLQERFNLDFSKMNKELIKDD